MTSVTELGLVAAVVHGDLGPSVHHARFALIVLVVLDDDGAADLADAAAGFLGPLGAVSWFHAGCRTSDR